MCVQKKLNSFILSLDIILLIFVSPRQD